MRILLDTNVLLLLPLSPDSLPSSMKARLVEADELLVSSVSRAEIGIKVSIGKLHLPAPEPIFWDQVTSRLQIVPLPFEVDHAALLASLPLHHRDPFDRMIVAQCLCEDLHLATTDGVLAQYGVRVV